MQLDITSLRGDVWSGQKGRQKLKELDTSSHQTGVDGSSFYFVLFCRETIETSLQTNQAYRMSFYLPRVALNRFYMSLIVLNCWSTPLILRLYKRDEAKKRFICLICDCVLDLVAAVVIPCVIIVTYVNDFDMTLYEFPMALWYEDIWFMHAFHEFQILFVTSWRDLATRMVFSIGIIIFWGLSMQAEY
uniref:Uncharacterized protein n=1 Tax=Globisporangium ultimum (strain ATCC 200006 / CBS 805.95 / DAOM BR144) TaxID=431595 RepID=K3WCU5_GLOUD